MSADFTLEAPAAPRRTARRPGMSSHQSKRLVEDEWLTDPEFKKPLGDFDLDPCAPVKRPWDTAREHFTIHDNGLKKKWHGRVWLNPPYGTQVGHWLARAAEHKNVTALVFARTETRPWHRHVWPHAHSILFVEGRLWFYTVDGTRGRWDAGAPSAVIAYDAENAARLMLANLPGHIVHLR